MRIIKSSSESEISTASSAFIFSGFIPLIMLFVNGMFGQIITSGTVKVTLCFIFVALATDFSNKTRIKDKNEKIKLRHAKFMNK